jgi:small subunit ribosomal protein S18
VVIAIDGGHRRTRRGAAKKKVCIFCKEHIEWVDYKDVNLLRRFMSDRGKIRARRVSGNCAQHQREVAVAIKTARELALLPYTQRTVAERTGPRLRRDAAGPEGVEPTVESEAREGEADEEELEENAFAALDEGADVGGEAADDGSATETRGPVGSEAG